MAIRVPVALCMAVVLLVLVARAPAARPSSLLDGSWVGTLDLGHGQTAPAAAAFGQSGDAVSGTLTLTGTLTTGTFTVAGIARSGGARVNGVRGAQLLRWRARWRRRQEAWRGRFRLRDGGRVVRGRLTFTRGAGGPAAGCGADYFAQELMPHLLEPVCAQCHVAGGAAATTRLRVTPGDPAATAISAATLVDATAPTQSLLLRKPRADVPHAGGQRVVPGSAEEQSLLQWIALITPPLCTGPGPGGPGGPGGTGDLYTDNCASCHGADARGVLGNPDIHCNRSIHDVVKSGREGAVGIMPAFPDLTDQDIATIQAFLAGLCPATGVTGAELWAGNCASCHGADAGGTSVAPSVRCATLVVDAVRVGRGAAMPSFPALSDGDVGLLEGYLDDLCTQHGRTGADLYAGNCLTCHGATAGGGQNGLGVRGPNIRCKGAGDYQEKIQKGEDEMPPFPALDAGDVDAIVTFVHGAYCPGG